MCLDNPILYFFDKYKDSKILKIVYRVCPDKFDTFNLQFPFISNFITQYHVYTKKIWNCCRNLNNQQRYCQKKIKLIKVSNKRLECQKKSFLRFRSTFLKYKEIKKNTRERVVNFQYRKKMNLLGTKRRNLETQKQKKMFITVAYLKR